MTWWSITKRIWSHWWIGLLAYEVTVLISGHKEALLTPVGIAFLGSWSAGGIVLGVLIGHFVIYRRAWMPWPPPPSWGLGGCFAVAGAFLALDIFTHIKVYPEASVSIGSVCGHFLWAQKPPTPSTG